MLTKDFATAMRRAASLTRAGSLAEATRHIQAALRGTTANDDEEAGSCKSSALGVPRILDLTANPVRGDADRTRSPDEEGTEAGAGPQIGRARQGRGLRETIRDLAAARRFFEGMPAGGPAAAAPPSAPPSVPPGARYLARTFIGEAGSRPYRIYVPSSVAGRAEGLVLMLHGCKQNPDDFAIGTRMNETAEARGLVVVYPEQLSTANPSGCWNWFDPTAQRRGAGEPAILAALAQSAASEFGAPADRIFVAGLSAGGAMAAILAETYPDVFAAAGIHSGLPTGSAHDIPTAFAAMNGTRRASPSPPRQASAPGPRLIVFHGTADRTVHPSNGEAIVAHRRSTTADAQRHAGRTPRGRSFSRIVYRAPNGDIELEHWILEGHGHAWSGGAAAGSYTDPAGPDASAEMIRFFLESSHRSGSPGRS